MCSLCWEAITRCLNRWFPSACTDVFLYFITNIRVLHAVLALFDLKKKKSPLIVETQRKAETKLEHVASTLSAVYQPKT